jgi:hypothetical protein
VLEALLYKLEEYKPLLDRLAMPVPTPTVKSVTGKSYITVTSTARKEDKEGELGEEKCVSPFY